MTERKGTGELGCSHIPGADPRMGKEIGIWVEVGSGHHTCSGYCLGVLSIVRILLGILLGITVAYLDTTEISSEHDTEGTLGPSQGITRALPGHTWQAGVTLSSLQGLSSGQQVRVAVLDLTLPGKETCTCTGVQVQGQSSMSTAG